MLFMCDKKEDRRILIHAGATADKPLLNIPQGSSSAALAAARGVVWSSMSSYSTPLPPHVTPGWNDPPTNIGPTDRKANGTRLFNRKYRRPVDPSIQGSGITTSLSTLAEPQAPNVSMPLSGYAQVGGELTHLQSSTPQYANGPGGPGGPYAALHSSHSSCPQLDDRSRATYDAFTVPSAFYQQPYDFAHIRSPSSNAIDANSNSHSGHAGFPLQQSFSIDGTTQSAAAFAQNAQKLAATNALQPVAGVAPPIEANPSHLIYTPPNVIGEQRLRPATSPDPASYVAPMKAAGDVSLNGLQLVQFITKATLRLPQGVTRDGIQLRIAQLQDLVVSNGISDGCIKKLNFVVDALDRFLYEDGLQFFEQMQGLYPEETRSGWAQGVRLLLQELKRPPRIGSASLPRTDTF